MPIIVPVRVVESSSEGVLCRLGSEPPPEAPIRLVPARCISSRSEVEGSDLALLVIDETAAPQWLRSLLVTG